MTMESQAQGKITKPGKAWRKTLYGNYSEHFGGKKDYIREEQFPLYDQIYPGLLPSDRAGAVLDLGCGKGEWLQWVGTRGFSDLTGVDLSEEDLEYARACGLKTAREDAIEYLHKQESRYALIHAKDLLEHLDKEEAVEFCAAAYSALCPGGRLILSTFNAQAPFSTATRYGDFTHESGFTPTSLEQLLRACRFDNVEVRGVHICPRGWKGRLRKFLYRPLAVMSRFAIALRHGLEGSAHSSCLPDLLACGTKIRL